MRIRGVKKGILNSLKIIHQKNIEGLLMLRSQEKQHLSN